MTLHRRLDALEDSLTPKELITTWMREAHEFGDYTSYGLWLMQQPEHSYPLTRLSQHLYDATKAHLRGRRDEELRAALRSQNRDLFFLFHLHSQLNERVEFTLSELRWRVLFLTEQLRHVMDQGAADEDQAELLKLIPGKKPRMPRRDKARDREKMELWRDLATALDEDLRDLLGAAERLSGRYLSGEDLLYPPARTSLLQILGILFRQRRLYYLCYGTKEERVCAVDTMDEPFVLGPCSGYGRDLTLELVTLAKAEALSALGEQSAGVRLVEQWMRRVSA
jgi:hypothetical protein